MSEDLIKQFTIWEFEFIGAEEPVWLEAEDEEEARRKSKGLNATGRIRHRVVMQVSSLWKITEKDEDDTDKP